MSNQNTEMEKLYRLGYQDGTDRGKKIKTSYEGEINEIITENSFEKNSKLSELSSTYSVRVNSLKESIKEKNFPEYAEGYINGLEESILPYAEILAPVEKNKN